MIMGFELEIPILLRIDFIPTSAKVKDKRCGISEHFAPQPRRPNCRGFMCPAKKISAEFRCWWNAGWERALWRTEFKARIRPIL